MPYGRQSRSKAGVESLRMLTYLIRRIAIGALTLLLITFIVYGLIRNMPGTPLTTAMSMVDPSREISAEDVKRLARHLSALTRDGVLVDGATFTSLAYAVGETSRLYIPETDDAVDAYFGTLVEVFGKLVGQGPLPRRCEAVDVLRKTGDARIAGSLTALFDAPVSKGLCPSAYVDLGERAPEVMVTSELLRLRILRALALVAVGNEEVLAWARDRAASDDQRYSDYIRAQIRELLRLAEAKKG